MVASFRLIERTLSSNSAAFPSRLLLPAEGEVSFLQDPASAAKLRRFITAQESTGEGPLHSPQPATPAPLKRRWAPCLGHF